MAIVELGDPCGTFTAPSGSLQSPNYPSNYTSGINCDYLITQPAYATIDLNILDVDVDDSFDTLVVSIDD